MYFEWIKVTQWNYNTLSYHLNIKTQSLIVRKWLIMPQKKKILLKFEIYSLSTDFCQIWTAVTSLLVTASTVKTKVLPEIILYKEDSLKKEIHKPVDWARLCFKALKQEKSQTSLNPDIPSMA